ERRLTVGGQQYMIAVILQDSLGRYPDPFFVFRDQNGLGPATQVDYRRLRFPINASRLGGIGQPRTGEAAGEEDLETRSHLQLALDTDVAAALLDDPLDSGQAQPGALADFLGREEGLENMGA